MDCSQQNSRPDRRPRGRLAWGLVLVALVVACVETPVEESLYLEFTESGALEVEVSVRLRHPAEAQQRGVERLRARLADIEEGWLEGLDPWTSRIAALDPTSEDFYWHKEAGRLHFASRQARVEDPAAVVELFADTAIQAHYDTRLGLAELALVPTVAGRATRRERRKVDAGLRDWSAVLADSLNTTAELYRYLDAAPDRGTACFAALFEVDGADTLLLDEEVTLLETLTESYYDVVSILVVDDGEDDTFEGLARRVFDPFPATITVGLPRPPTEVEGFEPLAEKGWRVPPSSPWAALERLRDHWVQPNPLFDWLAVQRAEGEDESAAAADEATARLAESPKRYPEVGSVAAATVEQALREALEPAEIYRLVWSVDPSVPSGEGASGVESARPTRR